MQTLGIVYNGVCDFPIFHKIKKNVNFIKSREADANAGPHTQAYLSRLGFVI